VVRGATATRGVTPARCTAESTFRALRHPASPGSRRRETRAAAGDGVVHSRPHGPCPRHDLPQDARHATAHRVTHDARRTAHRLGDPYRPHRGDAVCDLHCSRVCPTIRRRRSHHHAVIDRSPSVAVRAHSTHIWGQLCGQPLPGPWMNEPGSVDNSWSVRGQLPPGSGCPRARRPVHGPVPDRTHNPPRRGTCPDDVHPHHPQALLLLLDISSSKNRRRTTAWMERIGTPRSTRPGPGPGMAPVGPRLYGDRTGSARATAPMCRPGAPSPTSPTHEHPSHEQESSRQEHP